MGGWNEVPDACNGHKPRLLCQTCKIEQQHEVIKSVRLTRDHDGFEETEDHEIVKCLNCGSLSFRKEYYNSDSFHHDYEEGRTICESEVSVYPNRTAGRFRLNGFYSLPMKIRSVYDELLQALNGGQNILAGLAVRVLIEVICKDKEAEGRDLYNKIGDLVDKGVLTPPSVEILHKLRVMGNDSAHQAAPSSSEQLNLAMDVVDNLLSSAYIHPKLVQEVFK